MEVNKGLLAFFAEEEVAVFVVVHEEVFGEYGGADGVAEEVEGAPRPRAVSAGGGELQPINSLCYQSGACGVQFEPGRRLL